MALAPERHANDSVASIWFSISYIIVSCEGPKSETETSAIPDFIGAQSAVLVSVMYFVPQCLPLITSSSFNYNKCRKMVH